MNPTTGVTSWQYNYFEEAAALKRRLGVTNAFVLLPPLREPHKYYYYMYFFVWLPHSMGRLRIDCERWAGTAGIMDDTLGVYASREGDEDEAGDVPFSQAPLAFKSFNPWQQGVKLDLRCQPHPAGAEDEGEEEGEEEEEAGTMTEGWWKRWIKMKKNQANAKEFKEESLPTSKLRLCSNCADKSQRVLMKIRRSVLFWIF